MTELLIRYRTVLNPILLVILLLTLRKLIWCIRSLWCYYHGKPMPAPISWLPQQSGRTFDGHIRRSKDEERDGS